MSEKFKLGLTRNRLFEFDNCVGFLGEIRGCFDISECEKALKTLLLKEPILSCSVELCENGDGYIVPGKCQPALEVFDGDENEFLKDISFKGFDFNNQLFSFVIINKNTLGIFAHTVVADTRALMYLASELMKVYEKKALSVVPSEIKVISESSQLPSNVLSPVIERLASDLEMGWQKKTRTFDFSDYKNAREKYLSQKENNDTIFLDIDKDLLCSLKDFANRRSVDVSSLVAFAFYKSLTEALGGKRKYKKLNVQANERVFFPCGDDLQVGAYNGLVVVEEKKNKNASASLNDNAISFHKEIYKRVTSAFKVFYNEYMFMRLSPSFVDSQYIYCAGNFKHKYSKKLAGTYGCANEVIGEFCSFNLNQKTWSGLEVFERVSPWETLKMRSTTMITFVEKGEVGQICFAYKTDKISSSMAQSITEKVISLLKQIR